MVIFDFSSFRRVVPQRTRSVLDTSCVPGVSSTFQPLEAGSYSMLYQFGKNQWLTLKVTGLQKTWKRRPGQKRVKALLRHTLLGKANHRVCNIDLV